MSVQPALELFPEPITAPSTLADYDWIVVSSSGGKDSQAMLDYVCERAEAEGVLSRVVVVHADLGRVEWSGTREIAQAQAESYGVPFRVVWRRQGDLLEHVEANKYWPKPDTRYCTSDHKRDQIFKAFTQLSAEALERKKQGDLLTQVEERGMWPSPQQRYCTSDHKRAQVHRIYTAFTSLTNEDQDRAMAATPITPEGKPRRVRILSCQGMRAQESPRRAKLAPLKVDTRASNGKREVTNWLPIHGWAESEVWERLRSCRSREHIHYAYSLGMPRVSCCFCIFAPREALIIAGHHNRELLAEYVRVEEKIGHKFRMNLSMAEVQAAVVAGEVPDSVPGWTM